MKLRIIEKERAGRLFDITAAGVVIGREVDCDVIFDEEGVSRYHCRIFMEGKLCLCEDMKSTNGVRVNGVRVDTRHTLEANDRIGIGAHVILVTEDTAILSETSLQAVTASDPPKSGPEETADSLELVPAKTPASVPTSAESPPPEASDKDQSKAETQTMITAFAVITACILSAVIVWGVMELMKAPTTNITNTINDPGAIDVEDPLRPPIRQNPIDLGGHVNVPDPIDVGRVGDPNEPGDPVMNDEPPEPRPMAQNDTPTDTSLPKITDNEPAPVPADTEGGATNLWIASDPTGARIEIDDKPFGKTPFMATTLKRGSYMMRLSRDGYEDLTKVISIPSNEPQRILRLKQKDASVLITSSPPGAALIMDRQIVGYTPYMMLNFPPGNYMMQVVNLGYDSERRLRVNVDAYKAASVHVSLTPNTGALFVATNPPEAKVYVNSIFKAHGKHARNGRPAGLRIRGLHRGRHKITIEFGGQISKAKEVIVEPGRTTKVQMLVWVANIEVVTIEGQVIKGMLIGKNSHGDVTLAIGPNKKVITIVSTQIKEIHPLDTRKRD